MKYKEDIITYIKTCYAVIIAPKKTLPTLTAREDNRNEWFIFAVVTLFGGILTQLLTPGASLLKNAVPLIVSIPFYYLFWRLQMAILVSVLKSITSSSINPVTFRMGLLPIFGINTVAVLLFQAAFSFLLLLPPVRSLLSTPVLIFYLIPLPVIPPLLWTLWLSVVFIKALIPISPLQLLAAFVLSLILYILFGLALSFVMGLLMAPLAFLLSF